METKDFLANFPDLFIQTFDDKGEDRSLTKSGVPSAFTKDELKQLNERGAGIFFSPNRFTKQRKKELCQGVNAWFFEIDGILKSEQAVKIEKSPVAPSFVVETRNSYHVYFMADGTATVERFEEIQRRLIAFFDADKACKDITRVLRIPGFYHNKQEPYMVRVVANTGYKHSEQTMLDSFPAVDAPPPIEQKKAEVKEGMDFWESAFNLDCRMALDRLSGTYALRGEVIGYKPRPTGGLYITVDGKPADAWLDVSGRIGSGKSACPSIIQWLQFYGWEKREIAEIIKKHFENDLPNSALGKESADIPVAIQSIDRVFDELEEFQFEVLPVHPYIDSKDIFLRGSVTRIGAWSNTGKSRFAYWLAVQMLTNGKRGAIFSTEVIRPIVLGNIVQCIDRVPYKSVVKDKKQPSKLARDVTKNLSIYDGRDGAYYLKSIQDIIAKHGDLDFVIVDFCQDVADMANSRDEYVQMSNYAVEAQKVAQDYGVCFIDLSQVSNEQAKAVKSYKSGFVGLKGSGHLYSKGDIVLHLEKDAEDVTSPFVIKVVKHKYGAKCAIECSADFVINQFSNFKPYSFSPDKF